MNEMKAVAVVVKVVVACQLRQEGEGVKNKEKHLGGVTQLCCCFCFCCCCLCMLGEVQDNWIASDLCRFLYNFTDKLNRRSQNFLLACLLPFLCCLQQQQQQTNKTLARCACASLSAIESLKSGKESSNNHLTAASLAPALSIRFHSQIC